MNGKRNIANWQTKGVVTLIDPTPTNQLSRIADGCLLVVFGATGDLTKRKLYPAIYNLFRDGVLPERFGVVSIGRRDTTAEEFQTEISDAVSTYSRKSPSQALAPRCFFELFHYFRLDFTDTSSYAALKDFLEDLDYRLDTAGNRVFFLAVAPEFFGQITTAIHRHDMASHQDSWQRVVIEKPFGRSLDSAKQLDASIREAFAESEIYRIDHYLGKEMTQNLMVIRFANTLFEPLWNSRYIDHVQITLAETGGVEGRGPYYEQSGALRDMVQNHMLQLLTLLAMEPPVNLDTESIRDEKVKVLRSLSVDPSEVVRGQYGSDERDGRLIPAYVDEERVARDSPVETFVALKVRIENFRWAGVPFFLRTGKRLKSKLSQIAIKFKALPGVLYFRDRQLDSNLLIIRMHPDEGVYLRFNAKKPGTEGSIVPVAMKFCQTCQESLNSPEAYERLLFDVMRGESTLFTRWDEVEHSWRFVDQIAEWWDDDVTKTAVYAPGTWGPASAEHLIQSSDRDWFTEMGGFDEDS